MVKVRVKVMVRFWFRPLLRFKVSDSVQVRGKHPFSVRLRFRSGLSVRVSVLVRVKVMFIVLI